MAQVYPPFAISAPPVAAITTTTHGGTRQNTSIPNATSARPKSARLVIALVHTGSKNAASSSPTTAQLIPRSGAWLLDRPRSDSQNGRAPISARDDGREFATQDQ